MEQTSILEIQMALSSSTLQSNPNHGKQLFSLILICIAVTLYFLTGCSHEDIYGPEEPVQTKRSSHLTPEVSECLKRDQQNWYYSKTTRKCLPKKFKQYCATAEQTPKIKKLITALHTELNTKTCYDLNSRLEKTNQLHLSHYDLTDLSPLKGLQSIKILRIDHNHIKDISVLSTMTGLEVLRADHNQIHDISPIINLPKLVSLRLDFNQIQKLPQNTGTSQLKFLNLGSNDIRDISPLRDFLKLEKLGLRANPVSNITPLAQLEYLRIVDISATDLEQNRGQVKTSECPTTPDTTPAIQEICQLLTQNTE